MTRPELEGLPLRPISRLVLLTGGMAQQLLHGDRVLFPGKVAVSFQVRSRRDGVSWSRKTPQSCREDSRTSRARARWPALVNTKAYSWKSGTAWS
jgi:hypothetical protein